jgi:hypothetical protein
MEAAAKTALLTVVAVLAVAASAGAQAAYNRCADTGDATLVEVSAASCDEARRVATALAAGADGESAAVLRGAGWNPLRAAATSDSRGYDLIATRGRAALRHHDIL